MSRSRQPRHAKPRHLRLPKGPVALQRLRHDARTPLNTVLGFAELIMDQGGEVVPASWLGEVKQIHTAGKRMLELSNEIFSALPSALHQLDAPALMALCRAPSSEVSTRCDRLKAKARKAGLAVTAEDLRLMSAAADTWLTRLETAFTRHCR